MYPDNEEIKKLALDDTEDHKTLSLGSEKLIFRDKARITRVIALLQQNALRTPTDFLYASLIFLRGDTIQDLENGLICSQKAIELGLPPFESLLPQATDKLQVTKQTRAGIHKSLANQHFGTQIALWMDNGKSVTFNPLDGTLTDQELQSYGLPDCRKYEGKHYQDYLKALQDSKKTAAHNWQSTHKQ